MHGTALPEAWVIKCQKCGCTVNCRAVDPQAEHIDPDHREPAPTKAVVVTCSCCWGAFRYPASDVFRGTPHPSDACRARITRERERTTRETASAPKSKSALLIAASLIAAVRLHKQEVKPSPLVHAKIADSIALAEMILARLNGKLV